MKNRIKKLFSLLLTLVILTTSMNGEMLVQAAVSQGRVSFREVCTTKKIMLFGKSGTEKLQKRIQITPTGLQAQVAYCTDLGSPLNTGDMMIEDYIKQLKGTAYISSRQRELIERAATFGFQANPVSKTLTDNEKSKYIATQALIWSISEGFLGTSNESKGDDYAKQLCNVTPSPTTAWNYYKTLKTKVKQNTKIPSFMYTNTKTAEKKAVKLEWNSKNKRYEKTLTDKNSVISAKLIKKLSGTGISYTRSKNKITLYTTQIISKNKAREVSFQSTVKGVNDDNIFWWGDKNNRKQQIISCKPDPVPIEAYLSVYTEPLTNDITLYKYNETTSQKGAEFTLYSYSDSKKAYESQGTMKAKGNKHTMHLDLTRYLKTNSSLKFAIAETKTPVGYSGQPTYHNTRNNSTIKLVDIKTTKGTVKGMTFSGVLKEDYQLIYDAVNHPLKAQIQVTKKNPDGKALKGAKFMIYSYRDATKKYEPTGFILQDKGNGTYTHTLESTHYTSRNSQMKFAIVEVEAPEGYEKNEITWSAGGANITDESGKSHKASVFTLNQNTQKINCTATNQYKSLKIKVKKVDATDSKKLLAGAEFTLYEYSKKAGDYKSKGTKLLDKGNGIYETRTALVQTEDNEGLFRLKETAAPEGYLNEDWTENIYLQGTEEKEITFTVANAPETATLVIQKTGDILTGAETVQGKLADKLELTTEEARRDTYSLIYDKKPLEGVEFTVKAKEKITIPAEKDVTYYAYVIADSKEWGASVIEGKYPYYIQDAKGDYVQEQKEVAVTYYAYEDAVNPDGYTWYDSHQEGMTEYMAPGETTQLTKEETHTEYAYVAYEYAEEDTKREAYIAKTGDTYTQPSEVRKIPYIKTLYEKDDVVGVIQTDAQGTAALADLPKGEYYFYETAAPQGYAFDSSKTYEVSVIEDEKGYLKISETFRIHNDYKQTYITIKKKDSADASLLENAVYGLYCREDITLADGTVLIPAGTLIDKEATGSDGKAAFDVQLPLDKHYYVKELQAPQDYYLSQEELEFQTESEPEGQSIEYVQEDDHYIRLKIQKLDKLSGEYLPGITLQLEKYNEATEQYEMIMTWETDTKPLELSDFPAFTEEEGEPASGEAAPEIRQDITAGKYRLVELQILPGYVLAEPVEFELNYRKEVQEVTMYNWYSRVEISKTDITGEEEVTGATLQVIDGDGNIIDEWISGETRHLIEKLEKGKTYTLRETITPFGYQMATDISFTVTGEEEIQKVTMKDEMTQGRIKIYKVSSADEKGELKPLAGAEFTLVNSTTGEEIETLTSKKDGYVQSSLLPIGEYKDGAFVKYYEYVLKETKAPEGYIQDETEETIRFDYVDETTPVIEVEKVIKNRPLEKHPEPEKPKERKGAPKLGDSSHVWLCAILAGSSATALAAGRKRKKRGTGHEGK